MGITGKAQHLLLAIVDYFLWMSVFFCSISWIISINTPTSIIFVQQEMLDIRRATSSYMVTNETWLG
jgi:hypothetical protein